MSVVAFLGPVGTHTEEALLSLELPDITPQPYASIDDVFTAVERGKADLGVVPIENSIEGSVNATLDGICRARLPGRNSIQQPPQRF